MINTYIIAYSAGTFKKDSAYLQLIQSDSSYSWKQ